MKRRREKMDDSCPEFDFILASLEDRGPLSVELYNKILESFQVDPNLDLFRTFERCLNLFNDSFRRTWTVDAQYIEDMRRVLQPWHNKSLKFHSAHSQNCQGECSWPSYLLLRFRTDTTREELSETGRINHFAEVVRTTYSNEVKSNDIISAILDIWILNHMPADSSYGLSMTSALQNLGTALRKGLGQALFKRCFLEDLTHLADKWGIGYRYSHKWGLSFQSVPDIVPPVPAAFPCLMIVNETLPPLCRKKNPIPPVIAENTPSALSEAVTTTHSSSEVSGTAPSQSDMLASPSKPKRYRTTVHIQLKTGLVLKSFKSPFKVKPEADVLSVASESEVNLSTLPKSTSVLKPEGHSSTTSTVGELNQTEEDLDATVENLAQEINPEDPVQTKLLDVIQRMKAVHTNLGEASRKLADIRNDLSERVVWSPAGTPVNPNNYFKEDSGYQALSSPVAIEGAFSEDQNVAEKAINSSESSLSFVSIDLETSKSQTAGVESAFTEVQTAPSNDSIQRCPSVNLLLDPQLGLVKRAQFNSIASNLQLGLFHKDPDEPTSTMCLFQSARTIYPYKEPTALDWKQRLIRHGQNIKDRFKTSVQRESDSCLAPPHLTRPPDKAQ